MGVRIVRVLSAVGSAGLLTCAGAGGGAVAGPAAVAAVVRPVAAAAAPGSQLWAARFAGSGDIPSGAMAVSPRGSTVFVTGASYGGKTTGLDYKTVAYSGVTGGQLWASLYSGPGHREDRPTATAVSPDGGTVVVTGYAPGWGTRYDYATVAYDTATGRLLWASRYTSPGKFNDLPCAVAVSPDGATVFVAGTSGGRMIGGVPTREDGYTMVAYDAVTGRQLWVSRYVGPAHWDRASAMAVSPDGRTVFETGFSGSKTSRYDYATVAYDTATGKELWVSRYTGPGQFDDRPTAVSVSPGGATVFVTGVSDSGTTCGDYGTVAYRAATGRQLWFSRYNGPGNGDDVAEAVAVSPDGSTVFVTGASVGRTQGFDYATVAYRAATGRQLWVSRYPGADVGASSVAVSPDRTTVYVTGESQGPGGSVDYATLAYRSATGRQLWVSRYKALAGLNEATTVAVSRDGTTVFVTGTSYRHTGGYDYATVAYGG